MPEPSSGLCSHSVAHASSGATSYDANTAVAWRPRICGDLKLNPRDATLGAIEAVEPRQESLDVGGERLPDRSTD